MALHFSGDPLHAYRLQSTTTLGAQSWVDVQSFTLTGQFRDMSETTAGPSRKFFRVVTP